MRLVFKKGMKKVKVKQSIIHYDKQEDALSFVLSEGEEERFEEIKPGVFVEFDKNDKVIGFEILDASKFFRPALRSLSGRALVGVARASR